MAQTLSRIVPLHLAVRRGSGSVVLRDFVDLVRRAAGERLLSTNPPSTADLLLTAIFGWAALRPYRLQRRTSRLLESGQCRLGWYAFRVGAGNQNAGYSLATSFKTQPETAPL